MYVVAGVGGGGGGLLVVGEPCMKRWSCRNDWFLHSNARC